MYTADTVTRDEELLHAKNIHEISGWQKAQPHLIDLYVSHLHNLPNDVRRKVADNAQMSAWRLWVSWVSCEDFMCADLLAANPDLPSWVSLSLQQG